MNIQEALINKIDIAYSYRLAKRMEQFRSNSELGYRTAGSAAEYDTGEMLREEMLRIGLSSVIKDAVTVDGWEFRKAELTYMNPAGSPVTISLGSYQTHLVTEGAKPYSLVYLGKGTSKDYEGIDVTGKIVLIDVNQRDEWWINYPVYQAHLKGAACVIAVQSGGYSEFDEDALNAQDIAGPEDAPALSISRRDAAVLKELLLNQKELPVMLEADSVITRNTTTYNITGCIPGKHPDRIVLLSAHYDSYFDGFQDDNTAVAMMFGIAKAYLDCGYQPMNTILLCAMAAEEWGVADSNFDWSAGAYEEVFTVHPEWAGKVIADLNFELPALAHGTRARIRCCYEYARYLDAFLLDLPSLTQGYPEETKVTSPIETWSDDFSVAISGIPSMVNDFTGGSFMETHYHSQFDNDSFYDEQVYRLHHELFTLLIEALDRTAVIPLCFTQVFKRVGNVLEEDYDFLNDSLQQKMGYLNDLLRTARTKAQTDYHTILELNHRYQELLKLGQDTEAEAFYADARGLEKKLLDQFKLEQDTFVRIDWYGNVFYPHEIQLKSLKLIDGTIRNLSNHNISSALRKLYQLDNNAYAFMFDKEVYDHFSEYVFNQPKERLKWGYHRLMEHENMYEIVTGLLEKERTGDTHYQDILSRLRRIYDKKALLLSETLDSIYQTITTSFIL